MRKLFTFFLAVLASVTTLFAWDYEDVQIGDLYYNLDVTTQTAEVTYRNRFSNYNDLTTTDIPSSVIYNEVEYTVTRIGDDAFYHCTGLTSVTIPNSVTWISGNAFSGCDGLTGPVYNDKIFAFMPRSYSGAYSIPDGIETIVDRAFSNCSSLTSVTIPNSVINIGEYAFDNVPNIAYSGSATGSPWGARSVNGYIDGYLVYSDNTKTTLLACSSAATGDIIIPNSVTSIGDFAFYFCTDLLSITIPDGITSIGFGIFCGCTGLTSVTIPNSVTSIGDGAFSHCTGLTSVTIPNSVTSIGEGAFVMCESLASVEIPSGVTSIRMSTFANCSSLTTIEIPRNVTRIDTTAFSNCTNLASVTIPSSVTSIGLGAFFGCSGLTSIINYATTPQVIDGTVFGGYENNPVDKSTCILYVPSKSISLYKAATGWKEFKNIVPIQASEANVTEVKVTPAATTADIAWPQVSGAASYELVIKDQNGNVICTLTFNAQGQLITLAFNAPARKHAPQQKQVAGFQFTVTGLEAGTAYDYTIVSKDENGQVLDTQNGSFTTTDTPTAIDNTPFHPGEGKGDALKVLHNGQIYILRGDKTYTLTGAEVK